MEKLDPIEVELQIKDNKIEDLERWIKKLEEENETLIKLLDEDREIIGYCIHCGKKTKIAPFLCKKHCKLFVKIFRDIGDGDTLKKLSDYLKEKK